MELWNCLCVCVCVCVFVFPLQTQCWSKKTQPTCDNFPQPWQQRLDVLICVSYARPSASCCDIQTEQRVISLGDLWLPHESCQISSGGSPGGLSLASQRRRTCIGLRPRPRLLLFPQTGGYLAGDLQMTWVGLVWSEAERGRLNNARVPPRRSHGSLLRQIIQ